MEYVKAMTGSEIARELGISRQAVSQLLKRTVYKVYKELRKQNVCDTPIETVLFMRDWFGVIDDDDIDQFYNLFPKKIKDEVLIDAKNYDIETTKDKPLSM